MAHDPYSRLYWRLSDEFPEVFDDASALGTYVQLLVTADAMWPSRPHVPADADMEQLVACGLVLVDGRRYSMKGLDKERKRRQRAGRKGAAARWADDDEESDGYADRIAPGIADRIANGMPSRAKPSQAKPSQDKTRQAARGKNPPEKKRPKSQPTAISELIGRAPT